MIFHLRLAFGVHTMLFDATFNNSEEQLHLSVICHRSFT